jgi:hypothetical protein
MNEMLLLAELLKKHRLETQEKDKRIAELEKEMDGICLAVLNNRGKSVTERTLVRVRGVVDKFNLPLNIL